MAVAAVTLGLGLRPEEYVVVWVKLTVTSPTNLRCLKLLPLYNVT